MAVVRSTMRLLKLMTQEHDACRDKPKEPLPKAGEHALPHVVHDVEGDEKPKSAKDDEQRNDGMEDMVVHQDGVGKPLCLQWKPALLKPKQHGKMQSTIARQCQSQNPWG